MPGTLPALVFQSIAGYDWKLDCALSPFRGRRMIKTDKKLSSLRQILAAIEHFEKKDYECAITLAAAGEGQVKETTTNHLFRLIRAKFSADETNGVIN